MLTPDEKERVERCIAEFEAKTGAQIVTAVVDKCDHYPEVPWKAFALGAALAALAFAMADIAHPAWPAADRIVVVTVAILGAGAVVALVSILSARCARLFVARSRAQSEVLHYAQVFFLRRELFATAGRNGILVMVSRFERQVLILPDVRLQQRVDTEALGTIASSVVPLLASAQVSAALCSAVV